MTGNDLFSYQPTPPYPASPALGRTDTSRAAAEIIRPKAEAIREMVIQAVRVLGPSNYKEICAHIAIYRGVLESSSQPRVTEMKKLGRLRDTGLRRDGCAVLEVAE